MKVRPFSVGDKVIRCGATMVGEVLKVTEKAHLQSSTQNVRVRWPNGSEVMLANQQLELWLTNRTELTAEVRRMCLSYDLEDGQTIRATPAGELAIKALDGTLTPVARFAPEWLSTMGTEPDARGITPMDELVYNVLCDQNWV